jgi:ABC-2 type transport system ATP-binding protein
MCFLENVHQSVETLSRLSPPHLFCSIIIHDPDVLVMDEPTDRLDPNQKHESAESSAGWARKRQSFSTHILEGLKPLVRDLIIDRGQIGPTAHVELKHRSDTAGAVAVRIIGVARPGQQN